MLLVRVSLVIIRIVFCALIISSGYKLQHVVAVLLVLFLTPVHFSLRTAAAFFHFVVHDLV